MRRYPVLTILTIAVLLYGVWCCLPDSKNPSVIWQKGGDPFRFGPKVSYAQGSQTIYQNVFTDQTALATSSLLTNIGQSNHILFAAFSARPGKTCNIQTHGTANLFLALEGSFDNVHWTNVGSPITTTVIAGLVKIAQINGYGAYPYLRVDYTVGDTTNCSLTANYTGTVPSATVGSFQQGLSTSYFSTWAIVQGTTAVDITNATTVGGRMVIYGLDIQCEGAETTLQLLEADGLNNVLNNIYPFYGLLAGQHITWSNSYVPYYVGLVTDSHLRVSQIDPGAGTARTTVRVSYRWE